jgi:RNA polymerase sigma-70 factor (family 1)
MPENWKTSAVFEVLFKQHYKYLCIVALRITKNTEDAEDAVQQAFSDVWLKRDTIHLNQEIGAYLYRVVKNKCLNMVNDRRIKPVEMTPVIGDVIPQEQHDEVAHSQRIASLWSRIDSLPEMCRKIFVMCKIEGKKYTQTAELLGISVKTVENQMGKALKMIREGYL